MDLPHLYRQMLRARVYELAVEDLWNLGLISGEMHLGTGEEAVANTASRCGGAWPRSPASP